MHPLRKVHTPSGQESVKELIPKKVVAKNHRIALEEGTKVFDFCNSPGFAILSRDVKGKLDELNKAWLGSKTKEEAENLRIKAQTWHEVIEMLARYLQDKESAEKALRRKPNDLSPQGEVSSEQD